MPTAWVDGVGRSLLEPRFQQVVPLLAGFDDSAFAKAARAELELLTPPQLGAVHLRCDLAEIATQIKRVTSAGYRSSITPLDLIPNQAAWCCCFQDLTDGGAISPVLDEALQQKEDDRVRWLLFLKVHDSGDAAALLQRLETHGSWIAFLLGEEGELNRDVNLLAEGAVCLMLAGWERFCASSDLSFERALLLQGPQRTYVLGIGSNGIDLPYHRNRWSWKVAAAVAARWRQPAAGGAAPEPPDAVGMLRHLVPRRGYTLAEPAAGDAPRPGLIIGNVELDLAWGGGGEFRPPKAASTREGMRHYLAVVEDTANFLRAVVLPNTRRFMQLQVRSLSEQARGSFDRQLVLPPAPDGLVDFLRKRLASLREPCARAAQVRLNAFTAGADFVALLAETHRRIDAVPSLVSALLRLALIAVGLIWLFVGPLVWGAGSPRGDGLGQWVFLGAVILLAALLLAVPASYAFRVRRAIRAMEAARCAMIDAHVWEVCGYLAEQLRALGEGLCRTLDQKEAQLDALVRDLAADRWQAPAGTNQRTQFGDGAVDAVLTPKLGDLIGATYAGFSRRLTGDELPLNAAAWRDALLQEAAAQVEELLADTRFDQYADGAAPMFGNRRDLLKRVIDDARKPSLPMDRSAVQPPVVCIGPPAWERELNELVSVQLHFLSTRNLVAVSVRPLDQG